MHDVNGRSSLAARGATILACLAVLVTVTVTATSANASVPIKADAATSPQAALEELTAGLNALAPFVSGDPGAQVLDVGGAAAAGLDAEVIALGAETVDSQNAQVAALRAGVCEGDNPDADRPNLQRLNDLASKAAVARKLSGTTEAKPKGSGLDGGAVINEVPGVSPCGEYAHPIPVNAPGRSTVTATNIETYFRNNNYHPTAFYACGASFVGGYECDSDWTKGRSYTTSTYGTCSSPRFRDQGYETGTTTGWIQRGEPNPEVDAYLWPYWNWGSYVRWWHSNR